MKKKTEKTKKIIGILLSGAGALVRTVFVLTYFCLDQIICSHRFLNNRAKYNKTAACVIFFHGCLGGLRFMKYQGN
jgi:hypothetical protein